MSGSIKIGGSWERETVNNVIAAMNKYSAATFLGKQNLTSFKTFTFHFQDVGANIGMYAVVIAAMGRRVVAVDADPENLAYIRKSLDLAQNSQYVDIIYNSVRYVGVNKKSIICLSLFQVMNMRLSTHMHQMDQMKVAPIC